MAPTICLSELPAVRKSTIPCSRRRQRVSNGTVAKQQRFELRRMEINTPRHDKASLTPPESPLWEPECPNDSCVPTVVSSSAPNVSARVPTDAEEHWRVFLARRKGLLDIVVRTMALVRRNNILQERVNALSAETRDFIHSVLNNPENKCVQQRLDASDCKDADVSSSTEETIPRPSLPPTPDTTYSSSNDVTSSCDSSEHDTEQSFSEDDES
ncbi:uncharacterized protein LOC128891272 [Hylaeus anthracinus]|uniref:uncharacterized protein LOC128876243 n=1 Tax=Hylaeus volcanicus TaxID=313075 RepID=UPI0023B79A2B|nr:uncharacterized protein LOC128876243 [Hylaeus volcanicus]XP_053978532.1 uncharacterized protein LOC128876243 [Hylaeus volcanicus]XP_053978616.1 uncharacterized protein LOC128876243 [Hylaeus volcanicus]XP_054006661.1 uncharacterized protein LOC128891272 [Hylaeus anthracinus]XP_054006662.1 uncharacterized protein LOC128891272 [Hylaeus anthracinus]